MGTGRIVALCQLFDIREFVPQFAVCQEQDQPLVFMSVSVSTEDLFSFHGIPPSGIGPVNPSLPFFNKYRTEPGLPHHPFGGEPDYFIVPPARCKR